jgi:hypothetical protein
MNDYSYNKLKSELRKLPRESIIAVTPLVVYCDKLRAEIEQMKLEKRELKLAMSKSNTVPKPKVDFEKVKEAWLKKYKDNPSEQIKYVLKSMGVDV